MDNSEKEYSLYEGDVVVLDAEYVKPSTEEYDIEIREIIYHKIGESKNYNNELFTVTAPYEVVAKNDGEPFTIDSAFLVINEPKFTRVRTFLLTYEMAEKILKEGRYRRGFEDFVYKMRLPAYKVEHANFNANVVLRITFFEKY